MKYSWFDTPGCANNPQETQGDVTALSSWMKTLSTFYNRFDINAQRKTLDLTHLAALTTPRNHYVMSQLNLLG